MSDPLLLSAFVLSFFQFLALEHWNLGFVSHFDIRISNFPGLRFFLPRIGRTFLGLPLDVVA
jgi:hypothetical protein